MKVQQFRVRSRNRGELVLVRRVAQLRARSGRCQALLTPGSMETDAACVRTGPSRLRDRTLLRRPPKHRERNRRREEVLACFGRCVEQFIVCMDTVDGKCPQFVCDWGEQTERSCGRAPIELRAQSCSRP